MNILSFITQLGTKGFRSLFEIQEAEKEGKLWWKSSTIWVNLVSIFAIIIQRSLNGHVVISLQDQATILAFINIVLRLISKSSVGFYRPQNDIKKDNPSNDDPNHLNDISGGGV